MKNREIAFSNFTLIDGNGGNPLENVTLLVNESKITAVGGRGEVEVPNNVKTLNLDGRTMIPGLIDAHLHFSGGRPASSGMGYPGRGRMGELWRAFRAANDAKAMLYMGYTGAKDCGSNIAIGLKRAIEEGTTPGPRIMAAGGSISNTYGHVGRDPMPVEQAEALGREHPNGVPECLRLVRTRFREGADFIKIASGLWGESRIFPKCMPSFSYDEVKAICDEAHRAYSTVASHCQGKESIMTGLRAGVDTFEHAREFDEECAKLMLKEDKIYSPTLAVVIEGPDFAGHIDEEKKLFNSWQNESLRIAHEYGVKIASGTDFSGGDSLGGRAMGMNALDLQRLVEGGLSPMEAIVSATKVSSEAMMMEDSTGTLESSKLADFVVINGDPLRDISMLQVEDRIGMVIKGGEIIVKRF
jgi:imidazolonepropionase-like amidohydrolase